MEQKYGRAVVSIWTFRTKEKSVAHIEKNRVGNNNL
jgi:hypothetical protein